MTCSGLTLQPKTAQPPVKPCLLRLWKRIMLHNAQFGDTKKACAHGQSTQGNFFLPGLPLATPAWDALAWVWTACSASASSKRIFEKSFPTNVDK